MWIPYRMFIVHSMFNSILFSEILSLFETIEHRKLYLHIEMVCLWFQTIVKISCAFSHQILRSSHLISTLCTPKKDHCIFSSPCWNNWTVVNGFEYVYDGTIQHLLLLVDGQPEAILFNNACLPNLKLAIH